MKIMAQKVVLLSILFASFSWASTASSGFISNIIAHRAGVILFETDGVRTTPLPLCVPAGSKSWAIDIKTVEGKALYALLLTAYNNGKKIEVIGQGSCPSWGDTEAIDYFIVKEK